MRPGTESNRGASATDASKAHSIAFIRGLVVSLATP
jgi:hypothetical protein